MLTVYEARSGSLQKQTGKPRITAEAVWIDLLNPTPEEEKKLERALKLDVPTREEQREIEVSSRLYQEDGVQFMTATVLYQADGPQPSTTPVTSFSPARASLRFATPSRARSLCSCRAATDPKPISPMARRF